MRGDLCPFDHGVDRIVVDDVPLNRPFDIIPPMATPLTGPVGIMSAGVPSRPPYFMSTAGVRNQYDLDPGYCKYNSFFIFQKANMTRETLCDFVNQQHVVAACNVVSIFETFYFIKNIFVVSKICAIAHAVKTCRYRRSRNTLQTYKIKALKYADK